MFFNIVRVSNVILKKVYKHKMFKLVLDFPDNFDSFAIHLFLQKFIEGVPDTSTGDKDSVCTGFPGFTVDKSQSLGFLAYGGIMFGDTARSVGMYVHMFCIECCWSCEK